MSTSATPATEMTKDEEAIRIARLGKITTSRVVGVASINAGDYSVETAVLANGRAFCNYNGGWVELRPVPGTLAGRIFDRPIEADDDLGECPACSGTGYILLGPGFQPAEGKQECEACGGSGRL